MTYAICWKLPCPIFVGKSRETSSDNSTGLSGIRFVPRITNPAIGRFRFATSDPCMILLPEVQQSRNYARVLAAKARLQIADGKFDEAIQTLQAGYAFARHVAAGQTIIHGLVGKSIAGMMSYQLRELIQQPDAPNLYWAISSLPRPIVDFRPGLDAEFDSVYLSFPKLRNLDKKIMTVEEVAAIVGGIHRSTGTKFSKSIAMRSSERISKLDLEPWR